MKKQASQPQNPQSGSIFIWLFVMIALFAALSYTMIQSGRQGVSSIDSERGKLAASEVLEYFQQISDVIKTMRIDGCKENQLGFQNNVFINNSGSIIFSGTPAPADEHCSVFYNGVKPIVLESATIPVPHGGGDRTGNVKLMIERVADLGTNNGEFVLVYPHINKETCYALNKTLGVSADGTAPRMGYIHIQYSDYVAFDAGSSPDRPYRAACFSDTVAADQDPEFLHFYYTVWVR